MKTAVSFAVLAALSLTGFVRAADINDPNIFNPTGGPSATAVSSSTYGGVDLPSYAVDSGYGGNQFFFDDGDGNQRLSLSNFSAPSGIATLRFFDTEEYQDSRVAADVTVYYSLTNYAAQTSAFVLNPANYTPLNGGVAYTLPLGNGGSGQYYGTGIDSAPQPGLYGYYDDLSVPVPVGTQSLLFHFDSDGIGKGFTEIQGFAAAPEPSTYAMMAAGFVLLGFCLRRRIAQSL